MNMSPFSYKLLHWSRKCPPMWLFLYTGLQLLWLGVYLLFNFVFNIRIPMTAGVIFTTLTAVGMITVAIWLFIQQSRWKRLMRELEGWFCPVCWYDLSSFRGQDGKPIRGICPECGGVFSVEDNQKLYNIKVQEHLGNKKT